MKKNRNKNRNIDAGNEAPRNRQVLRDSTSQVENIKPVFKRYSLDDLI